ncbi:hypothetical protein T11_4761, partial [Trichinella zimbabwensis]
LKVRKTTFQEIFAKITPKFSRKSPSEHPNSAQFTLKVRKTTFQEIFAKIAQ